MSINVFQSQPKGYVRFTSSQNWTVPVGVYKIKIIAIGGGGGGGGGSSSYAGGGGGSGATSYAEAQVNPGDVLSIQVGAGGSPGTGGSSPTAGGLGGGTHVLNPNGHVLAYAGGGGGGGAATSSANGSNGSGGVVGAVAENVLGAWGLNGNAGKGTGTANAPALPLGSAVVTSSIVTTNYNSYSNTGQGGPGGAVNSNGVAGTSGMVIIWWGD
jgi:hypothetical protein